MKLGLQQKRMSEIYGLLLWDLGYICGKRETGPNGGKREFLSKSAAFLLQLGKDLGFTEMRVIKNPAGIAISGEVSLYGMWGSGGVFFEICQFCYEPSGDLLYRGIKGIKDCTGGQNQWIPSEVFKNMEYRRLCEFLLKLKCDGEQQHAA